MINKVGRSGSPICLINEKKRPFKSARDGAYCPIKAVIREVDNQVRFENFVIVMITDRIGLHSVLLPLKRQERT